MSHDPLFLIAPMDILADTRLTHMQMRVLLALYSFRRKNTDTVWPSREALSGRCGYAPTVISRVTSQLAALGWLTKVGAGGRGQSTRYELTVPELPETVTDSVTVSRPETVTEQETVTESVTATNPVTVTDSLTVTESVAKRLPNRSLNGDRTGHPSKENRSRTDQEQIIIAPGSKSPPPLSPKLADEAKKPDSRDVWNAYATAYAARYGTEPVRNARVNGQIAQFVKRLPADEAHHVASWYVASNSALYVRSKHCVDLLLRDAEGLRTEWATSRRVTDTEARQADQHQAAGDAAKWVSENMDQLRRARAEGRI